jgi:hypothetical protein
VEDETARRRLCCRNVCWSIMNDGDAGVESWPKKKEKVKKFEASKNEVS